MLLKLLQKFWRGAMLCLILTVGQHLVLAEGIKKLDPDLSNYTILMTNNADCDSFLEHDGTVNFLDFIPIAYLSSAPIAVEDTVFTTVNSSIDIDVLDNDLGPGLWPASVNVTTPPSNGSISVDPSTGEITYTPNSNVTGEDSFEYEVCNADSPPACDDTWVVVYTNGVTAINDDNNTIINMAVNGNVLTNDIDLEGEELILYPTPHVNPSNGGVVLVIDGSYTYTPNLDFVGQDVFEYIICDNGTSSACDTAKVRITVTDKPSFSNNEVIANADESITNVGVTISANVLANDADVDGDNLTVNTMPLSDPSNGSVVLLADGSYTYTPDPGFFGQDQFMYEVCDDALPQSCAATVVVIDVVPDLNGALPNTPFAGDDFKITKENTLLSGNLSTNDSGGGTIKSTPIVAPQNGNVVINLDGSYSYDPLVGYTGSDQFVYATSILGGGISTLNHPSLNIPLPIMDNSTTSSEVVIGKEGLVLDVNITNLNITHTFVQDVSIVLESPEGTRVTLISSVCGDADDFDLIFDDEGAALSLCTDLVSGLPFQPFGGGALSSFDGENGKGTWKLEVTDSRNGDNGTLDSWGLEIEMQEILTSKATAYILVTPPGVTDIDEDNDGIIDIREVFIGDHDSDGTPDYADADFCLAVFDGVSGWDCSNGIPDPDFDLDGDGTPNISDGDYPYTIPDTDGDGVYDHLDLDTDNDGLPDIVEAGGVDVDGDGLVDVVTDSDNDGLVDPYDPSNSLNPGMNEGFALVDIDTDSDEITDNRDLDTDNDGIPDVMEAGGVDVDGDGYVDDLTDSDNDGLVDTYDPSNNVNGGVNEGTAISFTSTDDDGILDHLDLDADNDGIPDLLEAGGVDITGNGIANDLTDSDADGLVDDYDPENNTNGGVNEGTPHFVTGGDNGDGTPITACTDCNHDLDQLPPHLDLDADDDGILDIIEAGGTDPDNDGQIGGAVGANGYSNSHDPADGGTPFFTALVDDSGDTDNRLEYHSAVGIGDSDGDDVPDYLDVDADNDGVYDNYEAQGTAIYQKPSGSDDDGDGIDDAYDADDLAAVNGLDPYNNDSFDQPDYLDVDSDNDNIPDWQEVWDHLFDGDSRADNISGHSGIDSDGDGLLDVFDSDDSDPSIFNWEDDPANDVDGSNGISVGTLFNSNLMVLLPENGGDNINEPDYRDQLIDIATPLVYYGLSEAGGSSTQYTFNSITQMHEVNPTPTATRGTTYFIRDGWYYFYNPLEPTNYLFAVRYNASNPGTIPINELVDYVEIRLDDNPQGRRVADGSNAQLVMARDWHVVFKKDSEAGATYDIKYYFDPQEFLNLIAAADAMQGYDNAQLKWFKADQGNDVSFDLDDIGAEGIANMVDITSSATASVDWSTGAVSIDGTPNIDAGNGRNFISFEGLPEFSGGTAAISMSAALPVELNSFSVEENGCQIDLNWVTLSEENFKQFELERSRNGKDFTKVKTIKTLGKETGNAYFWNDNPTRGNHYYRLKIVDLDGSYAYSSVENATIDCGEAENNPIKVYPNPTQGSDAVLYIACESPKPNPTFMIMDLVGRILIAKTIDQESGWVKTNIEIGDLPPGSYYLISREVGIEHSKKFLKLE